MRSPGKEEVLLSNPNGENRTITHSDLIEGGEVIHFPPEVAGDQEFILELVVRDPPLGSLIRERPEGSLDWLSRFWSRFASAIRFSAVSPYGERWTLGWWETLTGGLIAYASDLGTASQILTAGTLNLAWSLPDTDAFPDDCEECRDMDHSHWIGVSTIESITEISGSPFAASRADLLSLVGQSPGGRSSSFRVDRPLE